MSRRRRLAVLATLLSLGSGIGCSLVYPYGAVEETPNEGPDGSTGGGTDAESTPPNDVTTSPEQDASEASVVAPVDAPIDQGVTPTADVEAGPFAPAGAVVISGIGTGTDGGSAFALSVLDPTSGKELSRENMAVVGVAYDGVPDIWYVFEALQPDGVLFTSPGDPVVLHVRRLDTHSGAWTELTSLPVPTLVSANLIAPLTDRLAYIAYAPLDGGVDGGSGDELVVLDTTTPASTSASLSDPAVSFTPLAFAPTTLTGTRPSLTGAQGGEVTLVQNTSTSTPGAFQFVTAKVGTAGVVVSSIPVALGPATSIATVGAGSYLSGGPANVFALPPVGDGGVASLTQYDPLSGAKLGADINFAATSARFQPLAISECAQMAFVGQLTATTLLAVPLAGGGTGTPAPFNISHSVSNVRFEPYTNTVIATFNGGAGYEISALTLSGTPMAPTLSARSSIATTNPWAPPGDLQPTTIAVRQPIPFACP